jgi:Flp pilus assembly protein TadB
MPIYDEAWSRDDQERYFSHLDRLQHADHSKRGWHIFLTLFAAFFFILWAESWTSLGWFIAAALVFLAVVCIAAFYLVSPRT